MGFLSLSSRRTNRRPIFFSTSGGSVPPIADPETWMGYETGGSIPKTWAEMETAGSYERTWLALEL